MKTAKIKKLKAELEKLSGKMVCFRARKKYNETQRKLQRAKRKSRPDFSERLS